MLANAIIFLVAFASQALAAPTPEIGLVARQGYTANCTATYAVKSGDNCNVIRDLYGDVFSLPDFYSWNPQIDSFCSNLYVGELVCVGVNNSTGPIPACPAPVKPGLSGTCDACYKIASGDSCYAVAAAHGISVAQFLSWNPDVDAACTNLEVGYNYCVGVGA